MPSLCALGVMLTVGWVGARVCCDIYTTSPTPPPVAHSRRDGLLRNGRTAQIVLHLPHCRTPGTGILRRAVRGRRTRCRCACALPCRLSRQAITEARVDDRVVVAGARNLNGQGVAGRGLDARSP